MKQDLIKFIKHALLVGLLALAMFSPVLYFNFIIDPYGIFRSDFTKQRIEPNSHFIKLRHVLHKPNEYSSFIFGNSRANNIDNTKIPGDKFFNLYYSIGLPKEHLKDMQRMLKAGIKIKNVLICLDFGSYMAGDWGRENDPLRKPYPDNAWEVLKFYSNYIFQVPDPEFKKTLLETKPNDIYENILVTGRAVNKEKEKYIETHRAEHIASENLKYPSYIGNADLIDEVIANLNEVKKLCKENNIQLKLAVNPILKVTYLGNDLGKHFRFLKRLAEVSEYYDFGGINRVTTNNYFYYESAHFRPIVGDAMINFMYNNKRIDSIPEFGELVDRNNVGMHLEKLRAQLK